MAKLDVLVIGSGGREYELARQMSLSATVRKVYVAPGNAGTGVLEKCANVAIGPTDVQALTAFAHEKQVGLAVLGMDSTVAAGAGDLLREAGVPVFGPNRAAGKLEWSKSFAAEFMQRHDIPQPAAQVVHSPEEALAIIKDKKPETFVLKADGLALGKGVVLPKTIEEAEITLRDMFEGAKFEGAGKESVVIQERLHGPEVSAFAITDGVDFVMLPLCQDHKRLRNNNEGPNTGGMGSYTPVPASIVSDTQAEKIRAIFEKTIKAIAKEGSPYHGVLYVGLMLAEERGGDPVVIEYNARFGDPEAEILLPVMHESGVDIVDMLLQTANNTFAQANLPELHTAALTIALASHGYPGNVRKGDEIFGLDAQYDNVIMQHAGTKHEDGKWFTAGGRVLYVTGFGKDIAEAATHAYAAIGDQGIHFAGMQYRTDIGWQAR